MSSFCITQNGVFSRSYFLILWFIASLWSVKPQTSQWQSHETHFKYHGDTGITLERIISFFWSLSLSVQRLLGHKKQSSAAAYGVYCCTTETIRDSHRSHMLVTTRTPLPSHYSQLPSFHTQQCVAASTSFNIWQSNGWKRRRSYVAQGSVLTVAQLHWLWGGGFICWQWYRWGSGTVSPGIITMLGRKAVFCSINLLIYDLSISPINSIRPKGCRKIQVI